MRPAPEVVHRDRHLLVLYKPSGLPTTSPHREACLVAEAEALDPDAPRLHPTSRLDAEVSGLVTFARTRRATEALLAARRRGAYGRLYLGVASARPSPAVGIWDGDIDVDPRDKRKRRVHPGGRPSATDYAVAQELARGTLLALRPRTGRTHQLRVHAAHAGCALVGDTVYGGPRRVTLDDGRIVTARRVMLHCAALRLPDVARGEGTLALRAPLPDDLRAVLAALGGDVAAAEAVSGSGP